MSNNVFDSEIIGEFELVIEFQETMMSISFENIDHILQFVQSYYERNEANQSEYKMHKDKSEFTKFLTSTILTVAHYRPTKLAPLSLLVGKLFENFEDLKEKLIHLPLTVSSTQWHIAFLFECFINGIIDEDDAYEIIHYYKYHYSSMHGSIYLIFQYFHQVIKKKDPQFYEDSYNYLIKNQRRYDINVSPEFLKIRKNKINDLKNINENEFEFDSYEEENFNDTVRYWFPKGSIERIIRDDDFEKFKEVTLNFSEFDLNEIYNLKSIFCYPEILKSKINYLSLSAFFGSVKIFNYLLELGATKNPLFEINRMPLIDYAIAGGNVEIIKQCGIDEENDVEIDHAINSSVEFFRFSIFQWIYDNKLESFERYTQIQTDENRQLLMFSPKICFLITAARVNNMKMLLFLLDNVDGSCDINQTDQFGWSPLHYAAKFRNIEAIKMILKCKLLNLIPKSINSFFILVYTFYLRFFISCCFFIYFFLVFSYWNS